jgi:triosephosphate isomerase (TIM)
MKPLIVANWKMNPTSQREAKDLFNAVKRSVKSAEAEVVICPPSVYLALRSFNEGGLILGAQNMFYEERGAFTGEISPAMLKDLGVEYVIIGHSERRKYFGETDETINKKIKKALETGLKVIFCIGETQEQHDRGDKNKVLENQLKIGLADIKELKNVNIAYEPVWAIGTGNNCSVEETKESIEYIKKLTKPNTRILYGGSVKSENSGAYIKDAGSDGLLVGGASLNAEEFIKIVKSAS